MLESLWESDFDDGTHVKIEHNATTGCNSELEIATPARIPEVRLTRIMAVSETKERLAVDGTIGCVQVQHDNQA